MTVAKTDSLVYVTSEALVEVSPVSEMNLIRNIACEKTTKTVNFPRNTISFSIIC